MKGITVLLKTKVSWMDTPQAKEKRKTISNLDQRLSTKAYMEAGRSQKYASCEAEGSTQHTFYKLSSGTTVLIQIIVEY